VQVLHKERVVKPSLFHRAMDTGGLLAEHVDGYDG
jgi:hypothetical protein